MSQVPMDWGEPAQDPQVDDASPAHDSSTRDAPEPDQQSLPFEIADGRVDDEGQFTWVPSDAPRRWWVLGDPAAQRPPSPWRPLPRDREFPANYQWDRNGIPDDPDDRWMYDAHPDHYGWNASVAGYGAAILLNAAYGAAKELGIFVPALDLRGHRPDQRELDPQGYNAAGDIAPPEVHIMLDILLHEKALTLTSLERLLLHRWIDGVWLRHSRSPERCPVAIRAIGLFAEDEVMCLDTALRAHAFTDFRWLLHCVDPRPKPMYGRTLDGPGTSRLFRMFPSAYRRQAHDPATWSLDEGGMSGSSADGSLGPPHAPLNTWQRAQQRIRWAQRRIRRVVGHAKQVEELAEEQETRLEDALKRQSKGGSILSVLLRGLRARRGNLAGDRTPPRVIPYIERV